MAAPTLLRLLPAALAVIALQAGCIDEHAPVAVQSSCPPWVDYPRDNHINDASPYLGCTNRANLEQMLDDKQDIVAGRTLGAASGERESNVVKAYQEGRTKTAPSGSSSGAAAILLPSSGRAGPQ